MTNTAQSDRSLIVHLAVAASMDCPVVSYSTNCRRNSTLTALFYKIFPLLQKSKLQTEYNKETFLTGSFALKSIRIVRGLCVIIFPFVLTMLHVMTLLLMFDALDFRRNTLESIAADVSVQKGTKRGLFHCSLWIRH